MIRLFFEVGRVAGRIAVLALLVILASCAGENPGHVMITGKLADATGMKLVLQEMETHSIRSVDSVHAGNTGEFAFNTEVKEPGFWLIKAPTGKIMVILLKPGDRVELSGSAADFPDRVTLKGPTEAVTLNSFYRQTRRNERKVDSLEMIIADRQDSADYYQVTERLDTLFKKIWNDQRELEIGFIDLYPGSLGSLLVLNYAFGLSPVLSPEEDTYYYSKVDSALMTTYPDNKHVRYHHQRVETMIHAGKK